MEIKKRSYTLTKQATKSFKSILLYSLNQWGEHKTKTYMDGLSKTFISIAKDPTNVSIRNVTNFTYKMMRFRKHYIIFEIIKTGILIILIVHESQDIETALMKYSKTTLPL